MLQVPIKTSIGFRTATSFTQEIRGPRITECLEFQDRYSIEAKGRMVRLDDVHPTLHFLVEYDEEIIRNQWDSVIFKRPLTGCCAEYKQTYSGRFRNVYYAESPELYIVFEPVSAMS